MFAPQVGTNPTETRVSGMHHLEGGWGKEINNPQDPTERKRGTDKLKGVSYPPAVERMVPNATRWIEQNNSGGSRVFVFSVCTRCLECNALRLEEACTRVFLSFFNVD